MYLVLHRGIGATSAIAAEVAVEHGAKREQGRAARPKSDREGASRAAASGMHLGCEEFLIATGHLCIKSAGGHLNVVQQTHLQMPESEASSVGLPSLLIDVLLMHPSLQLTSIVASRSAGGRGSGASVGFGRGSDPRSGSASMSPLSSTRWARANGAIEMSRGPKQKLVSGHQ
ncbi:hypothetical protein B0H11DRAFT_1936337 [Mycena galericulata]|nr:hypothetical protein B0H11DRAFT_1936337 [Mycena galericulata]